MKKRVVMRKCELCDSSANMYCESDEATLCWNCDAQVHSANFLVSKHSRTLLCHICQSLTPWNGSGPKLCPTVSVCENCVNGWDQNDDSNQENGGDDDDDPDHFDGQQNDFEGQREDRDENHNNNDEDEDEDEENQVVPWSSMPPPSASSSSTSEDISLSKPQPAFS